eukprot:g73818.t1
MAARRLIFEDEPLLVRPPGLELQPPVLSHIDFEELPRDLSLLDLETPLGEPFNTQQPLPDLLPQPDLPPRRKFRRKLLHCLLITTALLLVICLISHYGSIRRHRLFSNPDFPSPALNDDLHNILTANDHNPSQVVDIDLPQSPVAVSEVSAIAAAEADTATEYPAAAVEDVAKDVPTDAATRKDAAATVTDAATITNAASGSEQKEKANSPSSETNPVPLFPSKTLNQAAKDT